MPFQYIICVGSSEPLWLRLQTSWCFNTSYVSVQEDSNGFSIAWWYCFNTSYVSVQVYTIYRSYCLFELFQYIICVGSSYTIYRSYCLFELFQYIICVGSRKRLSKLKIKNSSFNTSYVSVQVLDRGVSVSNIAVSIHHMCRFKYRRFWRRPKCEKVSIHHMCRFKFCLCHESIDSKHVSIHHMCRFKIRSWV